MEDKKRVPSYSQEDTLKLLSSSMEDKKRVPSYSQEDMLKIPIFSLKEENNVEFGILVKGNIMRVYKEKNKELHIYQNNEINCAPNDSCTDGQTCKPKKRGLGRLLYFSQKRAKLSPDLEKEEGLNTLNLILEDEGHKMDVLPANGYTLKLIGSSKNIDYVLIQGAILAAIDEDPDDEDALLFLDMYNEQLSKKTLEEENERSIDSLVTRNENMRKTFEILNYTLAFEDPQFYKKNPEIKKYMKEILLKQSTYPCDAENKLFVISAARHMKDKELDWEIAYNALNEEKFPQVRLEAFRALAEIKPKKANELVTECLRDQSPIVRKEALVFADSYCGEEMIPHAIECLGDPNADVRYAACWFLRRHRRNEECHVNKRLIEVAEDEKEKEKVRNAAQRALLGV